MRILRNKFVIGLLCIAIGITAGFVLLPKSQNADAEMAQVVRLKQDVAAGTLLEKDMLEVTTMPVENVPEGASSSLESFLSRYSATQLYAGDILTAAKVRDTLIDPVAAAAAKGKQLASITVPSLSAGVSGTLLPGDVVSVMVTSKVTQFNANLGLLTATPSPDGEVTGGLVSTVTNETQTVIPEELRYLEVCKVTSADGTNALVNGDKDKENPNRLPVTITFYATEAQALKLAEVEQSSELHVTFVARGDAADAFIPRAERVLADLNMPVENPSPDATEIPSQSVDGSVPSPLPEVSQPDNGPVDFNNPEVGE